VARRRLRDLEAILKLVPPDITRVTDVVNELEKKRGPATNQKRVERVPTRASELTKLIRDHATLQTMSEPPRQERCIIGRVFFL